jgi:hypothetical protein
MSTGVVPRRWAAGSNNLLVRLFSDATGLLHRTEQDLASRDLLLRNRLWADRMWWMTLTLGFAGS